MSDKDQSQSPARETTQGEKSQTEQQQPRGDAQSGGGGGGGRHGGRNRRHQPRGSQRPPQQQGQSGHASDSVNMRELRELMEMFTSHGLTDFELENESIRVRLSRNPPAPQAGAPSAATPPSSQTSASGVHAVSSSSSATRGAAADGTTTQSTPPVGSGDAGEELHVIPSPIVGTFYRAPSPNAEPFVRAGSHVEADTTVCIIEAMKLMNEIQAETVGTVEKIYVENGQPVEYGQPLFGIKK
jgi:acetyl-CoA carboxylase biotin carboxyl carrier protein